MIETWPVVVFSYLQLSFIELAWRNCKQLAESDDVWVASIALIVSSLSCFSSMIGAPLVTDYF
jgi:hypothetical protein